MKKCGQCGTKKDKKEFRTGIRIKRRGIWFSRPVCHRCVLASDLITIPTTGRV